MATVLTATSGVLLPGAYTANSMGSPGPMFQCFGSGAFPRKRGPKPPTTRVCLPQYLMNRPM